MKVSDAILKRVETRIEQIESRQWKTGLPSEEREGLVYARLELVALANEIVGIQQASAEDDVDEQLEEEQGVDTSVKPQQRRKTKPRHWSPPR